LFLIEEIKNQSKYFLVYPEVKIADTSPLSQDGAALSFTMDMCTPTSQLSNVIAYELRLEIGLEIRIP